MSFARKNNASRASINTNEIYASGGFKNVYKGVYTIGERKGEACVCKIFKSGSVFEDSFFESELKVVAKSQEIVDSFNVDGFINKEIWLNEPTVWTFMEGSSRAGEKNLVEPMIANFEKFNSNTGWVPSDSTPWIEVMQALSHFSFHATKGQLLFCDLQGGVYKDGFVITDPVIMSMKQEYGPTDLGSKGISTFFSRHKCNKFCRAEWSSPIDKKVYFKVQKGSSMILPTRATRTALTQRQDSGYASALASLDNLAIIEE